MYTNNTTEQISLAIDVKETFVSPKEKKRVFQDYEYSVPGTQTMQLIYYNL